MKRLITYIVILTWVLAACEDVYVPEIENVDRVIVADARIVKGSNSNYITLTESQGFNDNFGSSNTVSGGKVSLVDSDGNTYELPEKETGKFHVNINLSENTQYKVLINFGTNIFESEFESVPVAPDIDTVYGIPEIKYLEVAGANDADDIRGIEGVQLYVDLKTTPKASNYRFSANKVMLYSWSEPSDLVDIMHYYWKRFEAGGIFNIAASPEYSSSKNIVKHPLYFFRRSVSLEAEHYLRGWIMILKQHNISESAYNYYKDLNAQLDSEGRIFDPVYVQARSNIKCINNPEAIILGNFEISEVTEHRYFIRFLSVKQGYDVKEIYSRYPIPWSGETIDVPPDFWVR